MNHSDGSNFKKIPIVKVGTRPTAIGLKVKMREDEILDEKDK